MQEGEGANGANASRDLFFLRAVRKEKEKETEKDSVMLAVQSIVVGEKCRELCMRE